LPADLPEWVSKSTAGIFEAPLTHEIALVSQQLTVHADPAGRFIAATAQVLDLTLVTADEELLGLSAIKALANS
jgi:PIN domain nuclease of toxin-antitoxin system